MRWRIRGIVVAAILLGGILTTPFGTDTAPVEKTCGDTDFQTTPTEPPPDGVPKQQPSVPNWHRLHLPIHINGDDAFTRPFSGVTSGSGAPEDPYVIENWRVLPRFLPGTHPLIHIENTDAHVVVKNCSIRGVHVGNLIWNEGIYLHYTSNVTIDSCVIENCFTGIWIHNATHNMARDCLLKGDNCGVYIRRSSHNVVSGCEADVCDLLGICISWGNDPYDEHEHVPSSYNTIKNCVCHGMYGHDEYMGAGVYLCCLSQSTGNLIRNVTCYDNQYGIFLHNWIYHTTVYGCTLQENDYGLRVYTGGDNCVYHNAFIDNGMQAYDPNVDAWCNHSCGEGNYWSDYSGSDADGDGVGDVPYHIPGGDNLDRYPLMEMPLSHGRCPWSKGKH